MHRPPMKRMNRLAPLFLVLGAISFPGSADEGRAADATDADQLAEESSPIAPAKTKDSRSRRVAIIGGGIGGSFVSKYLTDYDENCKIDAIDIFEPSPMSTAKSEAGVAVTTSSLSSSEDIGETRPTWQGSRVSSVTLSDGTVVELGASIIYDGNKLAVEMLQGDANLSAGRPFYPGDQKAKSEEGKPQKNGFGIYDGDGNWLLNTAAFGSALARKLCLLWRYNIDLFRISSAASEAVNSFDLIYQLLDSHEPATFALDTPDDIWEAVGLRRLSLVSYGEFLDAIGVCRDELPWWRSILPFQGCIRNELLSAVTINTYNQEVTRMNGLSGLVSFVPTKGELFSVKGGNYKLVESALNQARTRRKLQCGDGSKHEQQVRHLEREVTAVVGDLDQGMEVFSGEESQGHYDLVILAVPLQHCNIDFLITSHLDGAVLHPMPLGLDVADEEEETSEGQDIANIREHIASMLPSSAERPYMQVITTVLSNAILQTTYFNISSAEIPRSIYFTEKGKEHENVFTITHLTSDGVFKVFSQTELSLDDIANMFGPGAKIEFVQTWGGKHGGATPNFDGGGDASAPAPFLLYDGGKLTEGHGFGPALYYANAMESAVAAVEISAIGAKAVAKLCAARLELIAPRQNSLGGDEL